MNCPAIRELKTERTQERLVLQGFLKKEDQMYPIVRQFGRLCGRCCRGLGQICPVLGRSRNGGYGLGGLWCGDCSSGSWGIVVISGANDGFFVHLFRFSKSGETSRWGLEAMISYFAFEINTFVYFICVEPHRQNGVNSGWSTHVQIAGFACYAKGG